MDGDEAAAGAVRWQAGSKKAAGDRFDSWSEHRTRAGRPDERNKSRVASGRPASVGIEAAPGL